MKKWKAIRDCFVRDHRSTTAAGTGQAASKKKKYIFYDQLLFLLPHVKGNSNTGSNIAPLHSHEHVGGESQMEDIESSSAHEEILADDAINVSPHPPSSTLLNQAATKPKGSKRKNLTDINPPTGKRATFEKNILSSSKDLTNILASSLEWQKNEKNSDKNDHKAFLLSYVPVLDSMPFSRSMYLRGQISQLFSNYFAQNENHQESSTMCSTSSLSSSAGATPTARNVFSEESGDFDISDYIQL
ncbi:uncharacterized protein LOC124369766 isoform X1 [Homalodisca vitripennis]|uniref:uncharacterized protein LOC124369766 isoform X1 n=1 Tax=Homalodisca vitripennis TaxID=197043 RepID=UPI001EEC4D3A|nr:uncharacterized protein LOC124369766 isoform X1 [Homalodisca vitripennis]